MRVGSHDGEACTRLSVADPGKNLSGEEEGCIQWHVSPKHFTVEDEHCGIHMIRNALGGRRKDLLTGVMTVQPPYSRKVRDGKFYEVTTGETCLC